MKLLASTAIAPWNRDRIERFPASRCATTHPLLKRRPVSRFVLVEDLDYLYRTGKSRQILKLRWMC